MERRAELQSYRDPMLPVVLPEGEGGEILTSDTVRGLVAGKKFLFSDRGETAMRGFEDPVRLYEVSWRES